MLRGASNCRGCSLGPVCPVGEVAPTQAPTNQTFAPINGAACASATSPCVGGAVIPEIGPAVCLSGGQSPFGAALDLLISCGQNGTMTSWSLCAGTDKAGCGNCGCICRLDTALTAYANSVIGMQQLGPDGFCLDASFLPGSVNDVAFRLQCSLCA